MKPETYRELCKFDVNFPIESAFKPPQSWYQMPDLFEAEQEKIFHKGWQLVGPKSWVEEPGAYVTPENFSFPVTIARDKQGLRAFHNVCLHHRAEVVGRGRGKTDKFSCPYHGWTYGIDGKLRGTPHLKDRPSCLKSGLSEMSVSTAGPLLFVAPDNTTGFPSALLEHDFNWDDMVHAARREYTMECDWKIYIDNYLDGGYHVPTIHKILSQQLDLNSYTTEARDRYVLQSVKIGLEGAYKQVGSNVSYAWIYPNLMVNRYGPWLTTASVSPLSAGRTHVTMDYYIEKHLEEEEQFLNTSITASCEITREDRDVCESVQKGMCSPVDFRGVYVPKFEKGMHYFHQLLLEDILDKDQEVWQSFTRDRKGV